MWQYRSRHNLRTHRQHRPPFSLLSDRLYSGPSAASSNKAVLEDIVAAIDAVARPNGPPLPASSTPVAGNTTSPSSDTRGGATTAASLPSEPPKTGNRASGSSSSPEGGGSFAGSGGVRRDSGSNGSADAASAKAAGSTPQESLLTRESNGNSVVAAEANESSSVAGSSGVRNESRPSAETSQSPSPTPTSSSEIVSGADARASPEAAAKPEKDTGTATLTKAEVSSVSESPSKQLADMRPGTLSDGAQAKSTGIAAADGEAAAPVSMAEVSFFFRQARRGLCSGGGYCATSVLVRLAIHPAVDTCARSIVTPLIQ